MNILNDGLFTGQFLGGARRSIWTPAAIFAQGQQGVWYEPKPQYLYQDAAGTVPVTADGDPVGYMQDLSGNGNHATQSTSAERPVYRTDGTLHWLEFDPVDDRLEVAALGSLAFAGTPLDHIWATEITHSWMLVSALFGGSSWHHLGSAGSTAAPSSLSSYGAPRRNGTALPPITDRGDVWEMYKDKSVHRAVMSYSGWATRGYGIGGYVRTGSMRLYGLIVRAETYSVSELGQAEAHLAALAGVTL